MSVINKMLRDLDKQQQYPQDRGSASFKPQRKSQWLLWSAVPAALVAGWWGQAWFVDSFSAKSEQPTSTVTAQEEQKHPLAAVAQLVSKLPDPATEAGTGTDLVVEQAVSLQDVVRARVSPEAAAQLTHTTSTTPAVKAELRPKVDLPVAEQRVVQRVPAESVPEPASVAALADTAAAEDVQVSEFDQSGEFVAGAEVVTDHEWNETPSVAEKPRSLAIEKVQLNPEQQKVLLRQKAQKAESGGNLNQAVGYWQQIRQLTPSDSEAYLELSRLASVQRNDAGAVQILEQANAAGVQDPKLSMALAALALKQLDWAKALQYLQYEPDIFNYRDFYALKAAALQKTNQHAQAVQVFQQLARQQPDQARWWLGMALSYDALQQHEQALLAYRQVAVNSLGLSAESLNYVKKRIAALE